MTDRINFLSLYIITYLPQIISYSINVQNSTSEYFPIRECSGIFTIMSHNSLAFEQICHKCLQRPCKCVNWHQTIWVWNYVVHTKMYPSISLSDTYLKQFLIYRNRTNLWYRSHMYFSTCFPPLYVLSNIGLSTIRFF